jgi:hypothetical protein
VHAQRPSTLCPRNQRRLDLQQGYLRDVMAQLPKQRASQIGELLPNRWQPTG